MSGALQLVQWWNLPFTIPFVLAVIYLLLTAFGVVDVDQTDTADAGGAADAAEPADVVDAAHADVPADTDHPAVAHTAADAPDGPVSRALDLLGLGRVPLAIVIQVFFLVWGFAGWATTSLLQPLLGNPLLFFWPALLIALVCAIAATALLARPLARWLPSTESHVVTKHDLAGRIGTVVFPVTAAGGTVHVRDDRGNLHQIACRVNGLAATVAGAPASTEGLAIPKGAEVIVVSYEDATGRYLVVPSDLPALPRR